VEKAFLTIPTTKKHTKNSVAEVQTKPEILLKYKETDQAHIVLGVRSFGARSEYDTTLKVLSVLLGGGMSSRLFQKLREEMGVGYYIHSNHDTSTDHGLFTISTGIDTGRIDEVIQALIGECKKILNDEIKEEELNMVKNYIAGSFKLGLETSDSRAEYCAIHEIVDGKISTPDEEIEKINKVTIKDLKEIAEKIFVDEKLNMAIIGPYKDKERFEKLLTFK
jgi:predicted Zn-dependent peptidase